MLTSAEDSPTYLVSGDLKINFMFLSSSCICLIAAFSPFWCMMGDWNWILYFLMGTLEEICGVCLLQRELTC